MNHEQAQALIEAQFDQGNLAPHQSEALRLHLRACESCRATYDRFADLESELYEDALPQSMVERMKAMGPPLEAAAPVKKSRRWGPVVGVVLAVAASIAATAVLAPDPNATAEMARMLPAYELRLNGGERIMRGEAQPEPQHPRFASSTRVEMILLPDKPGARASIARAVLVRGSEVYPVQATWKKVQDSLVLEGKAGALFKAPKGDWRLVVGVGAEEKLPSVATLAQALPNESWQRFERRLELLE